MRSIGQDMTRAAEVTAAFREFRGKYSVVDSDMRDVTFDVEDGMETDSNSGPTGSFVRAGFESSSTAYAASSSSNCSGASGTSCDYWRVGEVESFEE